MIDLKNIIKESKKYHYIYLYNNKPLKYKAFETKQTITVKTVVIYIKLRTLNKDYYKKEKKSPFKTTGGPLFAEINMYIDGVKQKPKSKNKIYFPKIYLQSKIKNNNNFKWMQDDIIKCATAYYNDLLKQKLLAVNRITDF